MAKQKMTNWKYLSGLLLIIAIVWLTMVLCLAIIYTLLPSVEVLTLDGLAIAIVKLLLAGFILLAWLYSWNVLVRLYFRRNLNSKPKTVNSPTRKK